MNNETFKKFIDEMKKDMLTEDQIIEFNSTQKGLNKELIKKLTLEQLRLKYRIGRLRGGSIATPTPSKGRRRNTRKHEESKDPSEKVSQEATQSEESRKHEESKAPSEKVSQEATQSEESLI